MADYGDGHLIPNGIIDSNILFGTVGTYYYGLPAHMIYGSFNTGATIPATADVEKDVAYTDIFRSPLVGTLEGGGEVKISDRG